MWEKVARTLFAAYIIALFIAATVGEVINIVFSFVGLFGTLLIGLQNDFRPFLTGVVIIFSFLLALELLNLYFTISGRLFRKALPGILMTTSSLVWISMGALLLYALYAEGRPLAQSEYHQTFRIIAVALLTINLPRLAVGALLCNQKVRWFVEKTEKEIARRGATAAIPA